MKDRPILFSAPMVRALLEGRKNQTRRIVKGVALEWLKPGMFTRGCVASPENHLCPHGQSGDRLWVKETGWQAKTPTSRDVMNGADTWPEYAYDADGISEGEAKVFKLWGWKRRPSIFMPRQFSRILLEITAVRIERLQDISEDDAIAEGVEYIGDEGPNCYSVSIGDCWLNAPTAAGAYSYLWDSIKGAGSWDANPYVWVISLKRIES